MTRFGMCGSPSSRNTVFRQLWDWCIGGNPIPGMLVADLTDAQRADVVAVLDRRVYERGRPAVLTAALDIGVGTK